MPLVERLAPTPATTEPDCGTPEADSEILEVNTELAPRPLMDDRVELKPLKD